MRRTTWCSVAVVVLLCRPECAAAQNVLDRVRALYEAAAYEDALALLVHTPEAPLTSNHPARLDVLDEYRVLCLLALDRPDDAETVLLHMISTNPLYAPSFRDPAPRFLTLVRKIRTRVIPPIAQRLFEDATAASKQRRYNETTAALEQMLRLVEPGGLDPHVGRWLSDMTHAGKALLEVSRRSQTVYRAGDPGVTPAVAIQQSLPDPSALTKRVDRAQSAELELVIDTKGAVESATLSAPIHPDYDALLIKAAKTWTFRPARQNGRAVPWRTVMTIQLASH